MNIWPFRKGKKAEVEHLRKQVGEARTNLYNNLFKLDNATQALETEGARGMLNDMYKQLDEGKKRGR